MIKIIKKFLILLLLIIFIGIGILIYFITNEDPNVNEAIDKAIEKPVAEEDAKIEKDQEEENTDGKNNAQEEPEQFKNVIVDAVRGTLDFFFKKGIRIVGIGDSLTQGVGDSTGEGGYIDILDKTINNKENIVEFERFGKRGNRSDQLLKRLDDPEIAKSIKNADVILVTIGANDIMQVVKENFTNLTYQKFTKERDDFEKRLRAILTEFHNLNPDAKVYLLGLYNPFENYFNEIEELGMIVNDWNRTGRNVTAEFENNTFIPIKDLFDDAEVDLYAEDYFHPNRLGYHRIAKRVLEYLTDEER